MLVASTESHRDIVSDAYHSHTTKKQRLTLSVRRDAGRLMKSTTSWRGANVPVAITAAAIAAANVIVTAVAFKMTGFHRPVSVGSAAIVDEGEAVGLLFRTMTFWIELERRMAQRVESVALALLVRGVIIACITAAEDELVVVVGIRFLIKIGACH
jgi:hypothetical protein